jgi:hypothetical protein
MKKIIGCAAIVAFSAMAHAETASSIYSDLDVTKCKTISKYTEDVGGLEVLCKGIKGYDVRYTESDLRGTASFGPEAKNQCASTQSFAAFNTVGKKVEWRMVNGKPAATILRWFTESDNVKQNWLVVTKLKGKDSCRTAIIDSKMPNANVLAQQKADVAAGFNCEKDTVQIVSNTVSAKDYVVTSSPCGAGPYGQ